MRLAARPVPAAALFLALLATSGAGALPEARQADAPGVRLLTDFTASTPDFGWYVVNDNVMGGRSQGGFEPEPDGLFFSGSTNTNGGGFSSIRTRDLKLDLSAYAGLRAHVKADGRRYTWVLTTDARWRGQVVNYWAEFDTVRGEWREVAIPFSRFRPTFRGSALEGLPLDPARISGMGLMIYDGQDGPFELRIDRLVAYPAPASSLRLR
jgi:NADH dehydrogenase [ubiquinone] 1 alpha subcomplex assembly factor 1